METPFPLYRSKLVNKYNDGIYMSNLVQLEKYNNK